MTAVHPACVRFCALLSLAALFGTALFGTALAAPPKSPAPLPPLPLSASPLTVPADAAPPAAAPPASGDVLLYDGRSLSEAGLALSDWGGGSAEESTAISLAHGHALKITTLSPYEGAVVTFSAPVSVDPGPGKDKTLLLTLRLTTVSRHFILPPAAAPPSPDNAAPGGDNGQTNGAVFRAEPDGARFRLAQAGLPRFRLAQAGLPRFRLAQDTPPDMATPAAPPASNGTTQDFTGLASLSALRLVFTLENGAQVDALRPFPNPSEAETGSEQWVTLGVPLAALHFPPSAAASPLKSITIGGDDYAVFYLGEMKIVHDDSPIACSAGDQQTAAAGDVVTLHANASGGASSLVYTWDFDASDGVTAQATGQTVTTQYFKGGRDYKVTLTVSDVDSLKKPAVSTTVVHVE